MKYLRVFGKVVGGFILAVLLLSFYSQHRLNDDPQLQLSIDTTLACENPNAMQETLAAETARLRAAYGSYKNIPERYELPILRALERYPELRDTRIDFIVRKTFTPLESRPFISTIFGEKSKRRYQVIINPVPLPGMQSAMFESLSLSAQAGAIGHELGHTVYYESKSTWELVLVGLAYPWNDFRKKFERSTDVAAISHCLGDHLLQWSQEIHSGGPDQWSIGGFYLSPVEIEAFIQR